jgi:DnaJ-class molecular chaperone
MKFIKKEGAPLNDPYEILGVPRGASIDEVKKRYRELALKYHPDKYQGHELSELAQEKMKAINEAYDTILRERDGRAQPSGGQNTYGQGGAQPQSPYGQGTPYGQNPYGRPPKGGPGGCSCCECCAGLMCADCLCSGLRCC